MTATSATPLRGAAKTLVLNMEASLAVPTATSVRTIPATVLAENRAFVNDQVRGTISVTQMVAWAVVRSLEDLPSQNVYYAETDGRPSVVAPAHVDLGIPVDATRQPVMQRVDTMTFAEFVESYVDMEARARANQLTVDDFARPTISLTNPGRIGTAHSVPRLMRGQGSVIGIGALELPAEFSGASPKTVAGLGIERR
jgi:2-oxoglutarate dehydrogenase E1 component